MFQTATPPTPQHSSEVQYALSAAASLPKHSREDCRLAEGVEYALRATGYGALRGVEVSVNARMVLLVGRVPSYFLKQIAQAAALAVPGAHCVHNEVDVVRPN